MKKKTPKRLKKQLSNKKSNNKKTMGGLPLP